MTHSASSEVIPDLAFIAQQLFTAILWVDEDLSITWVNPQAEQLLATSRGRLLNQSILSLLAPRELIDKSIDDLNSFNSDSFNLDGFNLDSDLNNSSSLNKDIKLGLYKVCSLTERFAQAQQYQQPFIDHDHKIDLPTSSKVTISVDYSVTPVIHEQRAHFIIEMWGKDRQSRISEEQRQQQQYDVARHMLKSVAHEIRNPLAGIRGAAQLLQRQFNKFNDVSVYDKPTIITDRNARVMPQKLRTYTDIIISETDRLTQLIGQLLGPTQLPKWQTLNIHQPLEHVLTLVLNHYPQVALQRDYDLSLPELKADKDQLIQVFLNLINNACEAMVEYQQALATENDCNTLNAPNAPNAPNAASIQKNSNYQPQLYIQTRVAFQHTIGSQQHKQVLQITITDNGCGIDPLLIEQIFFPMVTHRASGTGLGLAIAQDIINRHHGMIDVSSALEQTSFTVYLPFSQPTVAI